MEEEEKEEKDEEDFNKEQGVTEPLRRAVLKGREPPADHCPWTLGKLDLIALSDEEHGGGSLHCDQHINHQQEIYTASSASPRPMRERVSCIEGATDSCVYDKQSDL